MITPLQYLFATIIAGGGLIGGIILACITPEELVPGKKYFRWGEYCIIAVLFGVIVFFFSWYISLFITVISVAYYFILKDNEMLLVRGYTIQPLILFIALKEVPAFEMIAAGIFVWGLVRGTQDIIPWVKKERVKDAKKAIVGITKRYLVYLILSFVIYLVLRSM